MLERLSLLDRVGPRALVEEPLLRREFPGNEEYTLTGYLYATEEPSLREVRVIHPRNPDISEVSPVIAFRLSKPLPVSFSLVDDCAPDYRKIDPNRVNKIEEPDINYVCMRGNGTEGYFTVGENTEVFVRTLYDSAGVQFGGEIDSYTTSSQRTVLGKGRYERRHERSPLQVYRMIKKASGEEVTNTLVNSDRPHAVLGNTGIEVFRWEPRNGIDIAQRIAETEALRRS